MKDSNIWHDGDYWYYDGIWRYNASDDGENDGGDIGIDGWWYDWDGEIEPELDIDVEILSLEKPILLYYYYPIVKEALTYAIYSN